MKTTPTRALTNPMSGGWNWLGMWSLYTREVRRFFKIAAQTFLAPVITALLFLAIFNLAFEGDGRSAAEIPFLEFLVPGLTLMALMTSCFANASFAVMFEKIVRTIVDTLMPPLSPTELTAGYVLSSTTRGLLVGLAVGVAMTFFVPLHIHAWGFVIFHAVSAALFMSSTGLITALWAEKVDHVASINNFAVLPLTFLSGTFYSIQHVPEFFQKIILLNPVFYMIDGFRYGFFGYADGSIVTGIILMIVLNTLLLLLCRHLFAIGYKIKA